MKIFLVLATVLCSVTSFAMSADAVGRQYNCQFVQSEKVQVQLNIGAFGNFALFKSVSMKQPERTEILSQHDTPYETTLDGYMPQPWPQGSTFRINLQKDSPFHDIVLDVPGGKFERLTLTCSGQ